MLRKNGEECAERSSNSSSRFPFFFYHSSFTCGRVFIHIFIGLSTETTLANLKTARNFASIKEAVQEE